MASLLMKTGLGRLLGQPALLGSNLKCSAVAFHTSKKDASLGETIQYLRFKYFHDPRHHLDNDKWAKLFAIEGNIKSGKAKFAEEFAKKLNLRHFPNADFHYFFSSRTWIYPKEEIEYLLQPDSIQMKAWNVSLDKIYTEPESWPNLGRYQCGMIKSRYFQHVDAMCHLLKTGQGAVVERSFHAVDMFRMAFKKMKWTHKTLNDHLYTMYRRCDQKLLAPQVMIYLNVPPEQCLDNIKANGTEAEKHITLDYLKALEEAYHTQIFPQLEARGVSIIELDWSTPQAIEDVLLDMDELPSLLHEDCKWSKLANWQLKRLIRENTDEQVLHDRAFTFSVMEELWDPDWLEWAAEHFDRVKPWQYEAGYNANLGDKHIWLK